MSSGVISLTKGNVTSALGYTPPTSNTTYSAGTGLTLTGTSFSLSNSGVTAGSYGPTANVSGSNGATINVPQITVDSYGRVTGVTNRVYTSVDTNTTYSLSSFGITATAAQLNFCSGVTSNIQTQLNNKAASSHTHSYLPLSGGTMTGTLTSASTTGSIIFKGLENCDITNIYTNNGTIKENTGAFTAIRNGLRFNWYDTYWYIGNLRGGSTDSAGFGVVDHNNKLALQVTSNNIVAPKFTATVATGTAPLTVSSTTLVSNLNADLLDGAHLAGIGGRGGVMRSWSRAAYTKVNQYFGNGNVVTIDPKPTDDATLSTNTTILSLGDNANRNTQLAFYYESDTIRYRRCTDSGWTGWATLLNSSNWTGYVTYIPRDRGSNTVSTLSNLPTTKSTVIANLSAATSISVASGINVGESITVICNPTTSFTQPIPTTGSYKSMDGSSLSVTSGKQFEINIYCYASNTYSISCKVAK